MIEDRDDERAKVITAIVGGRVGRVKWKILSRVGQTSHSIAGIIIGGCSDGAFLLNASLISE